MMPSNTQKCIMGNDLAVYVSEGLLGRGATLRSLVFCRPRCCVKCYLSGRCAESPAADGAGDSA